MVYRKSLFRNIASGFSLIEIIVVLGILGIMATLAITIINPQTQFNKANDGIRKSDLLKIQSALELYRSNNGDYPGPIDWCAQITHTTYPEVLNALQPAYLENIPKDPKYKNTGRDYMYWHNAFGRYRLYAVLDYTGDPNAVSQVMITDGGSHCGGTDNTYYNYKVTNP